MVGRADAKFVIAAEDRTDKALNSVRSKFGKLGAQLGIGLAAGVTALGLLAKRSLDSADALAKLSRQTGFNVIEIQKYQFAMQQGGVAQDKFNTGIQAFSKRIGELKQGTGGLFTFLQKYDQQLLNTLKNTGSTGEAFRILAERFGNIKDESTRAALGAAAFSRSAGIELAGGLSGGIEALKELGDQIERESKLLTQDQTEAAERANDAMSLLADTIRNTTTALIADFAPAIEAIANFIRATFVPVTASIAIVFNAIRIAVANTLEFVITKYAQLLELFRKIPGVDKFLPGIKESQEALEEFAISLSNVADDALNNIIDRFEQIANTGKKVKVELKEGAQGAEDLSDAADNAGGSIAKALEPTKTWAENLAEVNDELGRLPEALIAREIESFKDEIAALAVETDVLTEKINLLDIALIDGTLSVDQHRRAVERLTGATEDAEEKTEQFGDRVIEITRSIKDRVQDAFVGLYEDIFGGKALSSVKNFLNALKDAFIKTLAEIAAKVTVEKLFGGLLSGLGSGLGSLFGGSGGGGGGGGGGIVKAIAGSFIGKGIGKLFGSIKGIFGGGGGGGRILAGVEDAALGAAGAGGFMAKAGVALKAFGAKLGSFSAALGGALPAIGVALGAALVAQKLFGGGRSPQEIFRDELKQIARAGPAGFNINAGQLGQVPVLGGNNNTVFVQDQAGAIAAVAKQLGLGTFQGDGVTRIEGLAGGAAELGAKIRDAIQTGIREGFDLQVVNAKVGEITGTFEGAAAQWVQLFQKGAAEVGGSFEIVGNQSGELKARLTGDIEAWTRFLARETGFSSEQAREALRRLIQDGAVGFDALRQLIGGVSGELGGAAGAANALASAIRAIPAVPGVPSPPIISKGPGRAAGFASGGSFIVPGSGGRDQPFVVGLRPGELVTVRDPGRGATDQILLAIHKQLGAIEQSRRLDNRRWLNG